MQKVVRKDAAVKVTGQARYAADVAPRGTLCARLYLSAVAHGVLKNVDVSRAQTAPGVRGVLVSTPNTPLCGVLMQDRPLLAKDRVRYAGEPIAVVIAETEAQAEAAVRLIGCEIEPLPVVNSVKEALAPAAVLLHPDASSYPSLAADVKPQPGTNIASSHRIRKGDPRGAFLQCAETIEADFSMPATDHVAMEVRTVQAEWRADGTLWILSATQSPYTVRELVAAAFSMEPGRVMVETTLVGGGFGGKSAVQLEFIAALAAQAVPGRRVRLIVTREQDFEATPGRLALEAHIKLGADKSGRLLAGEMSFWLNCGAYSDIAPNMTKAIAVDCTGPYRLENLSADCFTVYTNHTYATAFRGFGHEAYTFCVERALDMLADKLNIDALEIRRVNAIQPGDLTPTQVEATASNLGNLTACLDALAKLSAWDQGVRCVQADGLIRAKGLACLWKTPNPPTDASAGAVVTFNPDGSANLDVGVVEMGNGGVTCLCQMLADRLRMPYARVHAEMGVNTRTTPAYWKTVASLSSFLAGKAVIRAADDALNQLKTRAAVAMRCAVDELDHGEGKVFLIANPQFALDYQELCGGIQYEDGNSILGPVIGRGNSVIRHVGPIAEDTGKGKTGHGWTVGAQAIEVEYDPKTLNHRLLNAWTAMDIGAPLDDRAARAMVMGGMAMGLSLACGEELVYSPEGHMENTSLRTYKVMHIGEEPRYGVEFVHTPQLDAPMGVRGYSEHGVIGMPAALGNALSRAAQTPLNSLPLNAEAVWNAVREGGARG